MLSFNAQYGKAVTSGTKAKLMSPKSFQYKKDIYNAILSNPQSSSNVDLFGTHFYGTQRSHTKDDVVLLRDYLLTKSTAFPAV